MNKHSFDFNCDYLSIVCKDNHYCNLTRLDFHKGMLISDLQLVRVYGAKRYFNSTTKTYYNNTDELPTYINVTNNNIECLHCKEILFSPEDVILLDSACRLGHEEGMKQYLIHLGFPPT